MTSAQDDLAWAIEQGLPGAGSNTNGNKPGSPDTEEADHGLTRRLADAILLSDHFAQDVGGKLYVYEKGRYVPRGERHIKKRVKELLLEGDESKSCTIRRSNEVVEYLRVDAKLLWDGPPEQFVNLGNGLLNVETLELTPHSPDYLSPIQLAVSFNPTAQCPAW